MRSVLVCVAHPDDETVLAGGMIAMLTQQNITVHIVCATRGEGGELGDLTIQRERLGETREAELRCAAAALGASVEVLDYVDPVIGADDVLSPFEADFDTLARQFVAAAKQHHAEVVLTHGGDGEYGHPAHQLVHQAVVAGVERYYTRALVYSVAALVPGIDDNLWNKNEPAHLALDIRPWAEAKIAAMECHVSQHALFMRRRQLTTVREALRTVESVRRVYPDTHGEPPDDAFAQLLRTVGAWTP